MQNQRKANTAQHLVAVPAPSVDPDLISTLTEALCGWYVRRDGKFYDIDNAGAPLSQTDVQRAAVHRFAETFPDASLNADVLKQVFHRAITEVHSDPRQSIAVWSGRYTCQPGNPSRIIVANGVVAINSWREPTYRQVQGQTASLQPVEAFLGFFFSREVEKEMFLNWLAWCLQNERDKPAWAPFFYSARKGTGKSTLCQLVVRLFGEENAVTQNSVDKLTARFNMTLLRSKLVVSEELQLRPDSSQGNTLKTYITEKATLAELKGREPERVEQYCCFLFTTNHLPLWIESDERRYYVVEVDHDGHASGPRAEDFAALVADLRAFMDDPACIASLYESLMQREIPTSFDPRSLNVDRHATPVMRRIQGMSVRTMQELIQEQLDASGCNVLPERDVVRLIREECHGSVNQTRHVMSELGWSKCKVKWGAVDHARAIWVRGGYTVAAGKVYAPDGGEESIEDHLGRLNRNEEASLVGVQ